MGCCIDFPAFLSSRMNICINKTNRGDGIDRISDLNKTTCGDGIDRISDLPSNIIDDILCRLSTHDTVRTSVLSRNWRYMWVSVPKLEFGYDFFRKCKHLGYHDPEIPIIISEVLFLHNGPINRFVILIPYEYKFRIKCLNKWIFFLSKKGLRHLVLKTRRIINPTYQIPSHFYSCQTMTICELCNFELSLPPAFNGFKCLLQLALFSMKLKSSALEILITSCPVLHLLQIGWCYELEYINVSSDSLNELLIQDCVAIKWICFEKAKNLTRVSIKHPRNRVNNLNKTSVFNFMKGLRKIRVLSLEEGYIKVLSAGIIPEKLHRSIYTLKYLHLNGLDINKSRELLFCICLLKSSPNLLGLFITSNSKAVVGLVLDHFKELNSNNCCLSQLQTVDIKVTSGCKHVMDLIRFLLANSSSLESLKFKVLKSASQYSSTLSQEMQKIRQFLSISQDLQKMRRASPKVKVEFSHDGVVNYRTVGPFLCYENEEQHTTAMSLHDFKV